MEKRALEPEGYELTEIARGAQPSGGYFLSFQYHHFNFSGSG